MGGIKGSERYAKLVKHMYSPKVRCVRQKGRRLRREGEAIGILLGEERRVDAVGKVQDDDLLVV